VSLPGESASPKARLAIVASALALRLGLRLMLQERTEFEIAGEAPSLEALEIELSQVDLLLAADDVPDLDTLPAAGEPYPAVLLLGGNPAAAAILMTCPLPAWGALPLDAAPEALAAALQALRAGLWVGDPLLMPQLAASPQSSRRALESETLTNRELEVLQGLSYGLANKQIGLALGISEHTVKFHVSSIYTKLGATNRTEAVRIGIQKGWVTL
jgi:DNA-binding NarL/FixJ family response regulator